MVSRVTNAASASACAALSLRKASFESPASSAITPLTFSAASISVARHLSCERHSASNSFFCSAQRRTTIASLGSSGVFQTLFSSSILYSASARCSRIAAALRSLRSPLSVDPRQTMTGLALATWSRTNLTTL